MKFNYERLEKRIKEACIASFVETTKQLETPLKDAIESWIWDWPNITFRQNNSIVGSPRNIVDTGTLRDSQKLFFNSWTYASYVWDTDYAIYIHEGYTTKKGNVKPARPWVNEALNNFNFKDNFILNLQRYL